MKYDVSYLKVEDAPQGSVRNWVKVGVALDGEKGRFHVKLDALPLERCWDGSFTLFPKEES